ncbi:hypothetical protein EMIHUDRAFT_102870 [Emiliania huxleyi CCMP1516]|uniref:THIF-type NAD/FAD binding fold domain-containing protein n=2 Tax=Emiliania huxleyi TaxID=2903 RepID=A0A0D3IYC5_EMIH1|nr:hypothetical protein EMIHUDRAFT_102870 [Emiliania huxleyi CCMP1516]EOD16260.1 hypothetical protein EMIHUDRAFT_102870 [Emiliania huxleyi CCMP1516]|eukprot:XP_005768689.1 hypothetical protein EMIHUDRAFT_102870 [Emiliania huxleyi CCMP1516]
MLLRASTLLLVGALLLASIRRRRRASGRPVLAPRCAAVEAGAAPLVVVVGLGGVGSHAAQLLLRGGVVRLRLVDFDQVTLSSLNRHATATRAEVGLAKALALRAALLAIRPGAEIDARVSLFNAAAAAELLGGPVALVIDAIDDIATKAELQVHCFRAGLPLLSALGAGGKADCGCLHVAPLADVLGDPVASSVGKLVRAAEPAGGDWWRSLDQRVECVYSSEKQRVGLLPMPAGASKESLGSQPTFRARVLPVLPPEHVRTRHLPEWSPPEAWPLSFDEVGIVVNLVFRSRCAISGLRPQDPSRPQFCLCPLDEAGPPIMDLTAIQKGTTLKPTQTNDRSEPVKESVTIKASPMNQLKEELKEKPKLNHVDTVDKSAPMIESSTKIAKDARPQLMSELLTKSSSHGIAAS